MTAQGLWWEGQGGDLQNRMRMMIRLTCMFTTHGSDCGLPGQRFGRLPQRDRARDDGACARGRTALGRGCVRDLVYSLFITVCV